MHTLERSQLIPVPRAELFAFFEDPRNLGKITPGEMGFRILKMDDLPVRPGFRIKYRIRVFGLPVTWVSKITEYQPGVRFADIQVRGPYASWRHEHIFEDANGGTLMRDRVQYELPFGILGNAVQALVVGRQLRHIFDYRARVIAGMFAANPVEA
jgi:ligand-binding SRPBCC domain-containing protein